jgi:hypothetical protein
MSLSPNLDLPQGNFLSGKKERKREREREKGGGGSCKQLILVINLIENIIKFF